MIQALINKTEVAILILYKVHFRMQKVAGQSGALSNNERVSLTRGYNIFKCNKQLSWKI